MCSAGSSPAGPCLSPGRPALCSSPHPAERPGLVPAAAPDWTPADRHHININRYLPQKRKQTRHPHHLQYKTGDLTYNSEQRKNIFLTVCPYRQYDLLSCYPDQIFMHRKAPRYCPCMALPTEWRLLCSVCCEGQKVRPAAKMCSTMKEITSSNCSSSSNKADLPQVCDMCRLYQCICISAR